MEPPERPLARGAAVHEAIPARLLWQGCAFGCAGNATSKPFTQAGASRFVVGEEAAEHGGFRPENRHVPIVVWGAGIRSNVVDEPVDTNQIAPTILSELGRKPHELQAVQIEGTKRLPHLH